MGSAKTAPRSLISLDVVAPRTGSADWNKLLDYTDEQIQRIESDARKAQAREIVNAMVSEGAADGSDQGGA